MSVVSGGEIGSTLPISQSFSLSYMVGMKPSRRELLRSAASCHVMTCTTHRLTMSAVTSAITQAVIYIGCEITEFSAKDTSVKSLLLLVLI